jgi:hypothetical protein
VAFADERVSRHEHFFRYDADGGELQRRIWVLHSNVFITASVKLFEHGAMIERRNRTTKGAWRGSEHGATLTGCRDALVKSGDRFPTYSTATRCAGA